MPDWKIKERKEITNINLDIHPVALELLFRRGIDTKEKIEKFLDPDYERDIYDPFLFSEMPEVVGRIKKAIDKKELVAIFGDYDVDGVTSTVIMKEALDKLGLNSIVYIPDRRMEGYGLNKKAVEEFSKKGVSLIITVDCGITNVEEIEQARKRKIDVIITDHHHIPDEVPKAYAIINPQLKNSGYPFKNLAGVGVTYKVVQALYKELLNDDNEAIKWMLDLVALGTVADCVPLLGENRVIVKYGLIVLSKARRTGLRELFLAGKIVVDEDNLPDTRKISFQIAPRINAAGRVDHASLAYDLLREENDERARQLALEIENSNQRRQKETDKIVEEIRNLTRTEFENKKFVLAVHKDYSIGIAGLVAGKIAEEFNKPTGVIQKEKKESRGSFRSIPCMNIIEVLEECRDLLKKCGGHDQAAGITVSNDKIDQFCSRFGKLVEKKLAGKDLTNKIEVDAEIKKEDLGFELAGGLKKLEPFGEGNEEPVFLVKDMVVDEIKTVGSKDQHIKMYLRPDLKSPKRFEAIGFNHNGNYSHMKPENKIDIVFNLQLDEWNGNRKIQLKIIDLKLSV